MGDLFNLDISSVKIVNKSKNKVNHKDCLNKYTERFSKLIKQYLDDPVTHDDDPIWECYIREKLTYDIISVTDRLELDDLVKAYRKKCKKGKTSSRPFNDMSSENY